MIDCVYLVTEIAPAEFDNIEGSLAFSVCILESSHVGFDINRDCPILDCPCKLSPGVPFALPGDSL